MCAIVGWLDPAGRRSIRDLEAMAASMAHRGPDDRGFLFDSEEGVALGHNRLSIIDLSPAGRQPMTNEDGSLVLVFNGEIYNFQELKAQLLRAGHRFSSRTDSEVVLHGYEEWGEALLDRVCGMYAFALWDRRSRSLFLARDPMGIKPLYYWLSDESGFHFASEIKAFLTLSGFRPRIDRRALGQYLETNFIYDLSRSSLDGVLKLPAGHALRVTESDLRRGAELSPRRYFTPPDVLPWDGTDRQANDRVERLGAVLREVVDQHLIADVPVGLLLSGGLDSSLVAALASRRQPVRTISMAFADSVVDERPFARTVARHIGSHHEELVIRPEEIAQDLERSVWYVDDLFGDWGVISTMLLYRRCRKAGVKVVLVGEGSDELFGGYPQHAWAAAAKRGRLGWWRAALRLYQGYSGRRWGVGLPEFFRTLARLGDEVDRDPFAAVRLFECRHQLPHCYNMKVDKASMAASVEARVPFLDVRVAKEAFSTPRELLLRDGTNKHLLRCVAARGSLLPPETTNRPKYGASMATSWMEAIPGFRSFARDVVLDRAGWAGPLGLQRSMEDYFDRGRTGDRFPMPISIFSIVAWRLLLLNLWSHHYGPKQPAESLSA